MGTEIRGVYAIAATPFLENGEIDEGSIDSLVEYSAKAGVAGLTILGIMGEAHKLTEAERMRVAERYAQASGGRLGLVVGASLPGVDATLALCRHAEHLNARGVMVAPPSGLKTPEAILDFYRRVAGGMRLPIVVQDEPVTTGVLMPASLLIRIVREVPAARYVKLEEAPTLPKITALRAALAESVGIFGGLGGVYYLEELQRGAAGIMTGFAYYEVLQQIYERFTAGDRDGAAKIFYRWLPLIRYEAQPGIGVALRKEILRRRGIIAHATVRQPGAVLDRTTLEELEQVLRDVEHP
jgi:4-hydroxy-tetrahydrodipicolinate synthase